MIYPVRSQRHKQARKDALIRLLLKHKILYLQRINKKRYPKQTRTATTKSVQFSGKTLVCEYDAKDIPAEAMIRRPSHIQNISTRALKEEAKRLNIDIAHKNEETLRKLVCSKWITTMRDNLSSFSISTESIKDDQIEACYNLFIGLKKAAYLQMAKIPVEFRSMSLNKLHEVLDTNRIACPTPSSRLACMACIEDLFLDQLLPIRSELSDVNRRRISAQTVFDVKYPFFTLPMLQKELRSRGIHPAKTLAGCRSILMGIEEDELKNQLLECMMQSVKAMLQYFEMKSSFDLNKDFHQLFDALHDEFIPEVFE